MFVMVCETRPLPVYPVFRHPGLPVAGKHSVFNLIHRHVRSFLLVSYFLKILIQWMDKNYERLHILICVVCQFGIE